MKVPYIKYIETLVAGRMKPTIAEEKLKEVGIEFPALGINGVRTSLASRFPEQFDPTSQPDPIWIHELGIEKMYSYVFQVPLPMGVAGIEGAFKIANDPLMFRLITSMALAGITDEDIELIINGKYDIGYSSEDVTEFLHYFFNVKDWNILDKQKYTEIQKLPEIKNAYKLALKGDKDYLLWKLGAAPNKSFDDMLRDMMVDSYYNFKERSKIDPDMAQKWGNLAIKVTDRLEKIEKETNEKQDMFADIQFQIKTADGSTSTVSASTKSPLDINKIPPHKRTTLTDLDDELILEQDQFNDTELQPDIPHLSELE